jgi:hypothetical protein
VAANNWLVSKLNSMQLIFILPGRALGKSLIFLQSQKDAKILNNQTISF